MSKIRVAYIVNTFPRWGGGWLLNEVRGLLSTGVELSVFSFKRPPAEVAAHAEMKEWMERTTYLLRGTDRECVAAGLRFLVRSPLGFMRGVRAAIRVGGRASHRRHIMEVFYLADLIRKAGAQLVHAQHADYVAEAAMAAAACLGLPFSFTGHARDLYTRPGRLSAKIRAASFISTCTGFNERYIKDLCARSSQRGMEPSKVVRVYHGVDLARFAFSESTGPPGRLISVARLKKKKGFSYLLDALALLRDKGLEFSLDIYGEGDQKEAIEEQARRLQLSDRVALKGAIEHDRIPEALRQSGTFVLACVVMPDQDRDGIPNTMLEAVAAGTPVVSTEISGIPELIQNGKTGLLVEERNVEQLSRALEKMITDSEFRDRCRREGRRLVEAGFSIEATGRTLTSLFQKAIEESQAA